MAIFVFGCVFSLAIYIIVASFVQELPRVTPNRNYPAGGGGGGGDGDSADISRAGFGAEDATHATATAVQQQNEVTSSRRSKRSGNKRLISLSCLIKN